MADAKQLWQVWRRLRYSRLPWEKVPGLEPMSKHDALVAMGRTEIGSSLDWDFSMAPLGNRPQHSGYSGRNEPYEPFYEGYRTKRMKPK